MTQRLDRLRATDTDVGKNGGERLLVQG